MSNINVNTRSIIKVALPIAFGSFTQFLIVFADNYFLSEVSVTSFNAAGNGSLFYITLCMFGLGLSSAAQIFIARRNGEDDFIAAGRYFKQSILLVLALAGILFIVSNMIVAGPMGSWITSDSLFSEMKVFLGVRSFGLFVYFPLLACNAFVIGIAKTRVIYLIAAITALSNIGLDYVLIFGHLGLPAMGIKGAAIASFSAESLALVSMLIYLARDGVLKPFQIVKKWRWSTLLSIEILKMGSPLVLQQLLSLSTWVAFFFLVESLGPESLKISHIVRNLYIMNLISIVGFAQATRTYVSTLIAEERQAEMKSTIVKLVAMNLIGVAILSHGLWLYPDFWTGLFKATPQMMADARPVLYIVTPALFIFAVSAILINAIEGAGHTRKAMLIEITAVVLYMSYIVYTIKINPQSLQVIWLSDYLYFGSVGIISAIVVSKRSWMYNKI